MNLLTMVLCISSLQATLHDMSEGCSAISGHASSASYQGPRTVHCAAFLCLDDCLGPCVEHSSSSFWLTTPLGALQLKLGGSTNYIRRRYVLNPRHIQ